MKKTVMRIVRSADERRDAAGNSTKAKAVCLFATLTCLPGLAWSGTALLLDDAYISAASPATNYGASGKLLVKGGAQPNIALLSFSPEAGTAPGFVPGDVVRATLRLAINAVTTGGNFEVRRLNTAFLESTVTQGTAPVLGALHSTGTVGSGSKNEWVLVDLTSLVKGWLDGSIPKNGIAVVGVGATDFSFDSKENTSTSRPAGLELTLRGPTGAVKVLDFDGQWGPAQLPGNSGNTLATPVVCRTQTHVAGPNEVATLTFSATASPQFPPVTDVLYLDTMVSQNAGALVSGLVGYAADGFSDGVASVSTTKRLALTPGVSYIFGAGFGSNGVMNVGAGAYCQGTVSITRQ